MKKNNELDVTQIQPELRDIVKVISKGIGPDIRNYLTNSNLDTNNAIAHLRMDYINTNLRDMVVKFHDDVEMKHFKRFVWTGILLIDRKHKLTITISAKATLNRIKAVKERKNPHYLQSMCHVLNGDLEADCKQMTIADLEYVDIEPLFDDEVYEDDFDSIIDAVISQEDGYRHCLIAYEAERLEVKSISLLILDKDLDIVQEISLMDLLQPDFGILTAPIAKEEVFPVKKDAHSLVKVKTGLKSKLANEPKKKTEISTKQEEVGKQA